MKNRIKIFKSSVAIILTLSSLVMLVACAVPTTPSTDTTSPNANTTPSESTTPSEVTTTGAPEGTTEATTTTDTPQEPEYPNNSEVLNNKKIIFLGNSFTYYGHCVIEKGTSTLTQFARSSDKGYFYQLCRERGANVSVTNWTFGNHTMKRLFGGNCDADRGCDGVDHASYLTDRYFDYVVIQPGSGQDYEFDKYIDIVMNFFRAANPDVKFIFVLHSRLYYNNVTTVFSKVKSLEDEKGVIIVDWGRMVYDIAEKGVAVGGANEKYNKNSFIVSKSSSDGYHPNMLTGYLTAVWIYCAITGDSPVGLPYSFATDVKLNAKFSTSAYISKYYTYSPKETNFDKILKSEKEILALQKMAKSYIEAKEYRN